MSPLAEILDTWLEFKTRQDPEVLLSVSIRQNSSPLLQKNYNYTCAADNLKLFNIGSVAKLFSAVIVLRVLQEKHISLDQKPVKYIDWLTEHPDKRIQSITFRHVLNHAAGLARSGLNNDYLSLQCPFPNDASFKAIVLNSPLYFDPGTKTKYSNLGIMLACAAVQTICGLTYDELAEQYITEPFNLTKATTAPSDREVLVGFTNKLLVVELK